MNANFLEKQLENNHQTLLQLANASMVWWTSGVVVCGGILFFAWTGRQQILQGIPFLNLVFGGVFLFLLSVIYFGIFMCSATKKLKSEHKKIADMLKYGLPTPVEYDITHHAILIGTSSFMLIGVGWILFWFSYLGIIH